MPDQSQCTFEPRTPEQRTFPPPFPQPLPVTAGGGPPPFGDRTPDDERYSVDEARIVLRELGAVLGYARDRIEDTAFRLPRTEGRQAMLRFERAYDVSTEMWQVSHETVVQLDELIERLMAATRVREETLVAEFPELREAAAAAG
jgi:hypothetical protein